MSESVSVFASDPAVLFAWIKALSLAKSVMRLCPAIKSLSLRPIAFTRCRLLRFDGGYLFVSRPYLFLSQVESFFGILNFDLEHITRSSFLGFLCVRMFPGRHRADKVLHWLQR